MEKHEICFYVDDSEKFAQFVYTDSTIYLDRKYEIFRKWKSIKRRSYVKHEYPSKVGWRLRGKVMVS